MSRTALVLRHVPFEGPAGFRAPLVAAGYTVIEHDVPAHGLPDMVATADLLIAMGGPMGVYEAGEHGWIAPEIAALAGRIAAGRPTLGICLGSQLIAAALGARVWAGAVTEVGFAPVRLVGDTAASPLRHLAGVPLLHWHGDTFDLPAGTERLAETGHYPNQAFRRGATLLALQFHPEMGERDGFAPWLDGADAYLARAGTSVAALRRDHAKLGPAAVRAGQAMLHDWLGALDA